MLYIQASRREDMRKRIDWDKVAENQFNAMPKDYQDGWRDLRDYVNQRQD